jgi:hypothetical protein
MPFEFLASKPREFNPLAVSGLKKEARDGVNAALEALTTWRNEVAAVNEKNGKRVIDQMAQAASALGWPEQVVGAARTQLQSIADVQTRPRRWIRWRKRGKRKSNRRIQCWLHQSWLNCIRCMV